MGTPSLTPICSARSSLVLSGLPTMTSRMFISGVVLALWVVAGGWLMGIGKGVGEVVGVSAVGDLDGHGAGEADELACAGVGDDGDAELRSAAVHGAGMLQDEGAGAAAERAVDALHRDVTGGAFDGCTGGKHLALAGGFEIAVDLFVNGHAGEGAVVGFVFGGLRGQFHIKRSGGVSGHGGAFLCWSGILRVGPRKRSGAKTEGQAQTREDHRSGDSVVYHFFSLVHSASLHRLQLRGESEEA